MSGTVESKSEWTKPVLEKAAMSQSTRGGNLVGTDSCADPTLAALIAQCNS